MMKLSTIEWTKSYLNILNQFIGYSYTKKNIHSPTPIKSINKDI